MGNLLFDVDKTKCSETPSRLKGIETRGSDQVIPSHEMFGNTFPFEGN